MACSFISTSWFVCQFEDEQVAVWHWQHLRPACPFEGKLIPMPLLTAVAEKAISWFESDSTH